MANPNPSPSTRFGAGISGNPAGKTARQRELEYRNAEAALEIRALLLQRLRNTLKDDATLDATLKAMDLLRFLKDTEDRGLGTPKASLDVIASGEPGLIDLAGLSTAALAELVEARDHSHRIHGSSLEGSGEGQDHADTSTA